MTRQLLRETNGQFRQSSLEHDFGLRVEVCPHCQGCNPYKRNEQDPFKWDNPMECGQCSAPLPYLPPATNPRPADRHSPDDGCGEWADELYREQLADLGEFVEDPNPTTADGIPDHCDVA